MAVTADEYVITHKKKRSGDLMRQVSTKSGLNPHSEILGDNRGIKVIQPSFNERSLMRKENRPMVCYRCGKPGQMASQCQSGRGQETNTILMGKPQGVATTNKIEEIYRPFVSWGFVWDPKRNKEIGINILRNTGASQSLILRKYISEGKRNSLNNTGIIKGISGEPVKISLYRINGRSGWKSGPINVGVVDKLLMKGISLLLGNDVEGRIIYPERERWLDEARSPRKEAKRRNFRLKMSAVVIR